MLTCNNKTILLILKTLFDSGGREGDRKVYVGFALSKDFQQIAQ